MTGGRARIIGRGGSTAGGDLRMGNGAGSVVVTALACRRASGVDTLSRPLDRARIEGSKKMSGRNASDRVDGSVLRTDTRTLSLYAHTDPPTVLSPIY